MACCLSPSCCPSRRSARGPATKSSSRRSTGVCRPSKSVASPDVEPPTPQTSTVVPDVVDRLRRRLCQDSGSGSENNSASERRTPCRCCRRCLGENDEQQAASTEQDRSPVRPTRLSPTPTKPAVPGTTTGTTEVGNADFMTLFFRNCERIVLDNATAIHEMLSAQAAEEEEQRGDTGDDWTSDRTELSSANTVEQRRRLSHDEDDDDIADNLRSDVASALTEGRPEDASTSTSCGRTDGSIERLVAPANSPVSPGSLLTSSLSDDVLLTTTCVCSPSTKDDDVADDHLSVRRRPSVSGQSPAAVTAVNSTADRSHLLGCHFRCT